LVRLEGREPEGMVTKRGVRSARIVHKYLPVLEPPQPRSALIARELDCRN
jgi:hypothetical protein